MNCDVLVHYAVMNGYVMVRYANVRLINGSVTHVIATKAIDSRDKWLGCRDEYFVVMRLEMIDQLNNKSH